MRLTGHAAEMILPLFYPVRCPVCQDIVMPKGRMICPGCEERPHYLNSPVCMKCGREVKDGAEYCGDCMKRARSFERGFSLMRYDRIGQESIRNFKECGRQEYARWYAAELVKRHGEVLRRIHADGIVPVPLHSHRLAKRGYNQAALLARELSRLLDIPVLDVLVRTRDTGRQKKLGAESRRRNMAHSIAAGEVPDGIKKIILTDDVFTTGSTAEACTAALKEAGVQEVYIVTVCMAG